MNKKIYIGAFLFNHVNGICIDSGVDNSSDDILQRISNYQALDDSEKKNIVMKLRGIKLTPSEKIKFIDIKKIKKL
jgi:hypothetical protein